MAAAIDDQLTRLKRASRRHRVEPYVAPCDLGDPLATRAGCREVGPEERPRPRIGGLIEQVGRVACRHVVGVQEHRLGEARVPHGERLEPPAAAPSGLASDRSRAVTHAGRDGVGIHEADAGRRERLRHILGHLAAQVPDLNGQRAAEPAEARHEMPREAAVELAACRDHDAAKLAEWRENPGRIVECVR